jgi:hypothetical protein
MKGPDSKIRNVSVTDERLMVELADGSAISVPLFFYPILQKALASERAVFEVYPRSIH